MVVFMPVVPQLGFVQQEEEHQANEQRHEQVLRAGLRLKRFRQKMHEGGGQQCAGRQAEHVLGGTCQHAEAQKRGQPHAADAGGQGSQKNRYQYHSCLHNLFET